LRLLIALLVMGNLAYFAGTHWFWEKPRRETYRLLDASELKPGFANLKLLSERVYGDENWDDEAVHLYRFHDRAKQGARFCQMLGPLPDAVEADALRDRLLEDGVNARRDDIVAASIAGYSVILGPYPDPDIAMEIHRDLNQRNLDNFLFSDAGQRNGISLGFFGTREAAQRLVLATSSPDYQPKIQERESLSREHWVFVGEGGELATEYWQGLQGSFPLLALRRGYCEIYRGAAL
jgi:hypothetical protein